MLSPGSTMNGRSGRIRLGNEILPVLSVRSYMMVYS
jgi:hypothetical protein